MSHTTTIHPRGVETQDVGALARLRPEVVPPSSVVVGGFAAVRGA